MRYVVKETEINADISLEISAIEIENRCVEICPEVQRKKNTPATRIWGAK